MLGTLPRSASQVQAAADDEENLFEPERAKKAREKRQAKARVILGTSRQPCTSAFAADLERKMAQ